MATQETLPLFPPADPDDLIDRVAGRREDRLSGRRESRTADRIESRTADWIENRSADRISSADRIKSRKTGAVSQVAGGSRQRELEPVSSHLLAARKLSKKIRYLPDHSDVQTRAGQAICQHLRLMLGELASQHPPQPQPDTPRAG